MAGMGVAWPSDCFGSLSFEDGGTKSLFPGSGLSRHVKTLTLVAGHGLQRRLLSVTGEHSVC